MVFYRHYFGRCSSELAALVPLPRSRGRSACLSDRLHDFSVTTTKCYEDSHAISPPRITPATRNSLVSVCPTLTDDVNCFKY